MSKYIYLFIAILIVSCKPDEITFVDPVFHTDSFTIIVTDTFIEYDTTTIFVTDTLNNYCWQINNPDHHDHTPWFECDNGYRGPEL